MLPSGFYVLSFSVYAVPYTGMKKALAVKKIKGVLWLASLSRLEMPLYVISTNIQSYWTNNLTG